MNFVELCRKGAGWPSLHRDVPVRASGKKSWSLSQDDVARFVGQVRSRSDDLQSELRLRDERIRELAEEKAKLVEQNCLLESQVRKLQLVERIKQTSEAMGLEHHQFKRLTESFE